MREFIVFYSWQSDLASKTNRNLIENALKEAGKQIEQDFESSNLKVIIDQATRDEPVSPNIPQTILKKINSADAFVADISTINSNSTNPNSEVVPRRVPNPNVTFELGYAVAQVGWERIIMVLNKAYGSTNEAPFDFKAHRISQYDFANDSNQVERTKLDKTKLTMLLKSALIAILERDPPRPRQEEELTPEQLHRIHDVKMLKWILSSVHIPTIEQFMLDAPYSFPSATVSYWGHFDGIFNSSLFYLYDENAESLLQCLHRDLNDCMRYGNYYQKISTPVFLFQASDEHPLTLDQQQAWDAIQNHANDLKVSLAQFLGYVRENYPEIDINDLSAKAFAELGDFMNE